MAYKRLEAIASLIRENEKVLDVGTDHGLVPIFLLKRGVTQVADASDIADGPLAIARKNIQNEGFENNINLYKSNGLESIEYKNYDSIIVAGMGGSLIADIIKPFNGRYILHATNNHEAVRKQLSKLNFKITQEFIVKERKVSNIIIVAEKSTWLKSRICKYNQLVGPELKKVNDMEVDMYYKEQLEHFVNIHSKSNNKDHKRRAMSFGKVLVWREKNL